MRLDSLREDIKGATIAFRHDVLRDWTVGFLLHEAGASSIAEAAYRFARHEPGADVVLFGTGDPDHLRANIAALLAPPLPLADRLTLTKLFGRLSGVGLDPPYSMPGPGLG